MSSAAAQSRLPPARRASPRDLEDLRQMVLLFETAEVLEGRAHRAVDPGQVAVLLRRAEQRRRDAVAIRARLVTRGVVSRRPDQPR